MGSRVKSESDKSICEKSMMVVANVIRLSSFSIAQSSLGVTTNGKSGKDLSGSDMKPEKKEPLVPHNYHFPTSSRRSQEPQSRANPTYVIKPVESNGSTSHVVYKKESVHHEVRKKKEECVDGLASDYIAKIRNKLGCGL